MVQGKVTGPLPGLSGICGGLLGSMTGPSWSLEETYWLGEVLRTAREGNPGAASRLTVVCRCLSRSLLLLPGCVCAANGFLHGPGLPRPELLV